MAAISVNYRVLGAKYPQLNTELDHLIQQFNSFDINSEGAIDQSEVMTVVRSLKQFGMDAIQNALQTIKTNDDGKIKFDDYLAFVAKLKDAKLATQTTASGASAAAAQQKKIIIKGTQQNTTHTINEDEKVQFVNHINSALAGDKLVGHLLPIDPHSMDIFDACRDGQLLAKLINHAVPDTIDERALNQGKRLNPFKMTENNNVVINSAKAIGCSVVNIGAQDLIDAVEYLILGLLWQIIKVGLLSKIDIKLHPELYRLLEPGESLDSFLNLPADQILLRWVNYHLKKASCPTQLTNFSTDIKDSVIYTYLVHALHPAACSKSPLQIPDLTQRAEAVLANAAKINAAAFVTPKAIVEGNPKLNLAFIANLFNMYPGLEALSDKERATLDDALFSSEGDRESRAFALWMNSLGVDPFVNNLFQDLTDGLILLQTMDKVSPGIVDWKKVNKAPVVSRFKRVENCNYVVVLGKSPALKFSLVGIQGLDLVDGNRTLTLGLVWQLMRAHIMAQVRALSKNAGRELTEEDLIAWANATVARGKGAKGGPVNGLRDGAVKSGVFFVDIINGLAPDTVDYSLVTDGRTDEDARMNAKYAISMARKLGATIFVLPEDITEGRQRLLLTFVGSLMALDK
ncbi:Fimbrin, actin-bundling protein [Catenaria anguillulae PL171]|uniref:Fimbrin n=1 Tax=Catenaria anguillulae PL171 TaxID=765915 RepID=A0A1Y2HWC5_9FUNG|nr:Fimbrin, actin-bundling protein [Catenaria anguillulae PL171]